MLELEGDKVTLPRRKRFFFFQYTLTKKKYIFQTGFGCCVINRTIIIPLLPSSRQLSKSFGSYRRGHR